MPPKRQGGGGVFTATSRRRARGSFFFLQRQGGEEGFFLSASLSVMRYTLDMRILDIGIFALYSNFCLVDEVVGEIFYFASTGLITCQMKLIFCLSRLQELYIHVVGYLRIRMYIHG